MVNQVRSGGDSAETVACLRFQALAVLQSEVPGSVRIPAGVLGSFLPRPSHHKPQELRRVLGKCPPLGLESLRVKDRDLRASSYQRRGLGPHRGRLNIQSGIEDGDIYDGAWCAQYKDRDQWLELDARRLTLFTGVILQGRSSIWRCVGTLGALAPRLAPVLLGWHWPPLSAVRVTEEAPLRRTRREHSAQSRLPCASQQCARCGRRLAASSALSPTDWHGAALEVFEGNQDTETPVLALLPEPKVARYLRINPQTWYENGTVCLRAEVLGCILPDPSDVYNRPVEQDPKDKLDFRHHNYKEMRKLMKAVNEECPRITRIYSIGKSHMGLKLYVMEISDNPGKHELGEPEFRYVAGMHGNEVLGRELVLNLMQYLCREYKRGNQRVVRLVMETRIHLLPSMNPDGYEMAYKKVHGSELSGWALGRYSYEGIDMNHNFANLNSVMWDAIELETDKSKLINHYFPIPEYYLSEEAFVAAETRAVISWMKSIPFVLSANLHGGELVVTYPFDMTRDWAPRAHTPTADDSFFRWLATVYASTNHVMSNPDRRICHNNDFTRNNNIINGANWHNVPGSMNDFSYLHTNCFEVTVELSCDKFPHASELPTEWENNRESLLVYMEQVHRGIKGIVRDKDTKAGIADAVIQVTVSAEGYYPVTRTCRVEYEHYPTLCDFYLTKTAKQRIREILAGGGKLAESLQKRLNQLRLRRLRSGTKAINRRRARERRAMAGRR
ncbi:hypothetical protein JZ751_027041 [Albula glossodonta]|uniref:F5/8 type C domain-containing protein n=1 Tax=Albula glossodonta TaxID=121402 RepID=A0A8T2NKK0_9TELE|nr:hypothetical protein JZ751_027041 [Albula glossodonta]